MEFAAFKDQVAAKAKGERSGCERGARGIGGGFKYQVAANSGEEDRDVTEMRAGLIELKDLIYANSENDQAITETKLETAELKNLV